MIRLAMPLVLVSILVAGCDRGGGAVPPDATKTADALTGDAQGEASDTPQCKLFKPSELTAYIGEPVAAGINAGMGTGCQWLAKDQSGDVMVVVVPADYHSAPTLADGYRELPEMGEKAYVAPEMGGFVASALAGADSVKVSVAGDEASPDRAIALLKETLKRRGSTPAG
jgi:hypothetical protein